MRTPNSPLLLSIWIVSVASSVAAAIMVWFIASHPLAEDDRKSVWLIYALPYVVIAITAWAARRNRRRLILLLVGTAVAATLGTYTRYLDLQTAIWVLETRAAGGHPLVCGPPQQLLALAVEYGVALAAAVASLELMPRYPA